MYLQRDLSPDTKILNIFFLLKFYVKMLIMRLNKIVKVGILFNAPIYLKGFWICCIESTIHYYLCKLNIITWLLPSVTSQFKILNSWLLNIIRGNWQLAMRVKMSGAKEETKISLETAEKILKENKYKVLANSCPYFQSAFLNTFMGYFGKFSMPDIYKFGGFWEIRGYK